MPTRDSLDETGSPDAYFAVDVLACPRCKGRRHFVSVITDPAVIRRILEHLKLPTEPLPLAPPRAPPQPSLPW